MRQHASLSPQRWGRFPREQQILMIANEMNRATRLMAAKDQHNRRLAYERVLRLVDLTVEVNARRTFRRELLRWRDLVAELYIEDEANAGAHQSALRSLLQLTPTAFAQVDFLLPDHSSKH